MPSKKKSASASAEPATVEIPKELLERLVPGPMTAEGLESVFRQFKKAFIERALGAEMNVHLRSPEGDR
jgi:putative transposase